MKRILIILLASLGVIAAVTGAEPKLAPSYAWTVMPPLGLHQASTIDTLMLNYYRQAIPSEAVSAAYATTGNTAAPGLNMLFASRAATSDFFFRDAISAWIPSQQSQRFYNTRVPMTLMSYNFGGGRENAQDRLKVIFSGNAGRRWQVGAMLDYIYSKGSYNYQAAKDLTWGVSSSYMGDRYEMQAYFYHYNNLNKENGGITDDLYILDPAELQGGSSSISPKAIPAQLTTAHSRVKGSQLYLNNRYKVGYYREETAEDDSTILRTYIPVTSFIWTLEYTEAKHLFLNNSSSEAAKFWDNTYFDPSSTHDYTTYSTLRNTLGVSLLEGFHPWVGAGLSAFVTHELRKYNLTDYDLSPTDEGLTAIPAGALPDEVATTQNRLWVGGQLTRQRGRILNYDATARFGLIGGVAGDIDINAKIDTHIPLLGDTLAVTAFGSFGNIAVNYLLKRYISNHFVWNNDFGKTRRTRFGAVVAVPRWGTRVNVTLENLQNYVYFGADGLPRQCGDNVQVFSASLFQPLSVGILHWDNALTYQATSRSEVIPLPAFTIYSNLYLLFRVAGVMKVQMGVDCDLYTKYYSPAYQPATMTFCTQRDIETGGYPFMNFYINMKLSKARFYVMFSHVNQGIIGGNNYFSMPHYPLNPRLFQLGVSVDFTN